ncbi:hypothetical protein [Haloplanus sp. C73]|uniref:hypothetical protein n=1 Tax=Haloplanus sp. C73 TaxID=3421641 RepID=UPI003EBCDA7E
MTEGEYEEELEELWTDFAPVYEEIEQLLKEWQRSLIQGNSKQVREEIRNFAGHQPRLFRFIRLCLEDVDQFWADLEVTIDESAVDKSQKIHNQYSSQLSVLFEAIMNEKAYGFKNTITETNTEIELVAEERRPRIKFDAYSGPVEVLNLEESPAHFLDFAHSHVHAVDSALEWVDEVSQDEKESVERQLTKLQEQTDELNERLEELETIDGERGQMNDGDETTEE